MKCSTVRDKLSAYLDAEVAPQERAGIATHLQACAACRAEAAALERAEAALTTLATVERAPDLTADLRRLAARAPRPAWRWAGACVAGVIVVGVALIWAHALVVRPSQPKPQVVQRRPGVAAPARPSPLQGEGRVRVQRTDTRAYVAPRKARLHRPVDKAPAPRHAAPEPPAMEPAPVKDREDLGGIILLVGAPRETAPSSSCYLEVSLPDGSKSVLEQAIERDADGQARSIRIACQRIAPETRAANEGG
jgi:hypothetical protein